MKKIILTFTLLFAMGFSSFAKDIVIRNHEGAKYRFEIRNPDNSMYVIEYDNQTRVVTATRDGELYSRVTESNGNYSDWVYNENESLPIYVGAWIKSYRAIVTINGEEVSWDANIPSGCAVEIEIFGPDMN